MKVLGLDISSVSTGWAVLEEGKLIDYGKVECDEGWNLGQKLFHFDTQLNLILDQHQDIEWIGIEDTFNNNTVTMKTLSKFAGVAIKCLQNKLQTGTTYSDATIEKALKRRKGKPDKGIFIVTPTSVNKLIGLQGRLEREDRKREIIAKVNTAFKLGFTFDDNDITDAVAIAMATINKIR